MSRSTALIEDEELFRITPALQTAMNLAVRSGASRDKFQELLGDLILDEVDLDEFLDECEAEINDPVSLQIFDAARTVVSSPRPSRVVGTPVARPSPIVLRARSTQP